MELEVVNQAPMVTLVTPKFCILPNQEKYYLQEKSDVSKVLANSLRLARNDLKKQFNISNFDEYDTRSQENIILFGKIVMENSLKNNSRTVFLQGDDVYDKKCRIRLDMSTFVPDICLFPGLIIAAKGLNPTGETLVVKQILFPISKPDFTEKPQSSLGGVSPRISICSGQLSKTTDLDYIYLENIISQVNSTKPDIFVLLGPLVDTSHPIVKSGSFQVKDFKLSGNELFTIIINRIYILAKDNPAMKVVVIPSTNDFTKEFVLPQPGFSSSAGTSLTTKPRNLYFLQNPAVFKINETNQTLAVLSDSVLSDFEEASSVYGTTKDKLTVSSLRKIAGHLLRTRNFYPMFPPGNVSVDYAKQNALCMPNLPDLLILPSNRDTDLSVSVKASDGHKIKTVRVISPGRLNSKARLCSFAIGEKILEQVRYS